jgi:hypothetical protein
LAIVVATWGLRDTLENGLPITTSILRAWDKIDIICGIPAVPPDTIIDFGVSPFSSV